MGTGSLRRFSLFGALLTALGCHANVLAAADVGEAQWVWSSAAGRERAAAGSCFFRKAFELANPERGEIEISADDGYELFVNGRKIGEGADWTRLDRYDVTPRLVKGRNVVAVKAVNNEESSAGLIVRVTVRSEGNTDVSHSTDASWRMSIGEEQGWPSPRFNDRDWSPAVPLGEFGVAPPWRNRVRAVAGTGGGRFTHAKDFRVERIVPPVDAGSLVAMTFNEFGEILASREKGPVLIVSDANRDGTVDKVDVFAEQVTNCQGLLALNGYVYAVGNGPDGAGFYRLADENGDRKADAVKLLFKFAGGMAEHGPHAPALGPDGRIYLIIGNHAGAEMRFKASSPYRYFYEGDLVQPRYEDAGGHAVGIKAPGGTVIRTDAEGSFAEVHTGGFRNAYDIAFNRQGDLFTFDSDMEWDVGLPWYRATRVCECVPGGEFGWRSGWANWPDYFCDSLPPTIECGRGSPTGVEFYNHHRFPERYRNALFACDWSRGRILAIHLKPAEGGYSAEQETFLEGRPLNVTDIAVGPDGWLYFCTGGRGTEGGVYRIVATSAPPSRAEQGISQALRQPQLYSAWARNALAEVKQKLGEQWDRQLKAAAMNARLTPADRTRALDLMQLFGPTPTSTELVRLSQDKQPEVRAKSVYLLGLHADPAAGASRLVEMLRDPDPTVRRKACEALVERGAPVDAGRVLPLLADESRLVRWAAGRLLERQPVATWQPAVIDAKNLRVFIEGAVARLRMDVDAATATLWLNRCSEWMKGPMPDPEFRDLLRIVQVALHRGGIQRELLPQLAAQLNEEYPTLDPVLNRELVRLLVYLREPTLAARVLEQITGEAPLEERLHAACYARFVADAWSETERRQLLEFYEYARQQPGGHSYEGYIDNVTRDLVNALSDEDRLAILDNAATIPAAAVHVLRKLGPPSDDAMVARLIKLDGDLLAAAASPSRDYLRTGIAALLSATKRPDAMTFLRERFDREPDRRPLLAMGLAESPDGENWPFLVKALSVADGEPAQYVVNKLAEVDRKPEGPEALRQAILCGLRMRESGGKGAAKLLAHWTGAAVNSPDDSWDVALAKWQQWFREQYPHEPEPSLPTANAGAKWSPDELLEFLSSDEGRGGDAARGASVFDKATCIKCHRYGTQGEGVGPDLSTVSQRFQRKEILESVLFPSQVISDQYASKTVSTKAGLTYTGIVGPQGDDAIVVLDQQAKKTVIPKTDIDEIVPARQSAMPESLFDTLTRGEIADLFAFLMQPPPN